MTKIIGNPTVTPMAVPDWNQTDSTKADFIKNKPVVLTEEEVLELIREHGSAVGKVVQSITYYGTAGDGEIQIYVRYTDGTYQIVGIPGSSGGGTDGVGISDIYQTANDNIDGFVMIINTTDGKTHAFNVYNGKTPQKGIDYWTDEDKGEIKSYIDEHIGDIDAALEAIIELQNSYTAEDIVFYIYGVENAYTANSNTTWEKYISIQENNKLGYENRNDGLVRIYAGLMWLLYEGIPVKPTDKIVADYTYQCTSESDLKFGILGDWYYAPSNAPTNMTWGDIQTVMPAIWEKYNMYVNTEMDDIYATDENGYSAFLRTYNEDGSFNQITPDRPIDNGVMVEH